jgi:Mg-chelatase subunit ChlD
VSTNDIHLKHQTMKKIWLFLCIMLIFNNFSFPQSHAIRNHAFERLKSRFDVQPDSGNQLKSASFDESKKLVRNQVWEYSMMCDGYFTLGTNLGSSDKAIDNNCEITFGHPYSKTSFAYPFIDGKNYNLFELANNDSAPILVSGDTLSFQQTYAHLFALSTILFTNGDGDVELEYQIINRDGMPHSIGMGLLFDAALGKWGDGFAFSGTDMLNSVTEMSGTAMDSLVLWERKQSPKGIGVRINVDYNRPDKIIAGNWYDEFTGNITSDQIYDLALHAIWEEKMISSNDTISFRIRFSLPEPDSCDKPFIRWDMPNFLSIENQQLFPSEISASVEIINSSKANTGLTLNIPESKNVYGWETTSPFELSSPDHLYYETASVTLPEIYDSLVVPVTLQLLQSGSVVDELTRSVFIPAAPFSNEGLEVTIDTIFMSYGKVSLGFHCANEETGQLIYALHSNNIFLYENKDRIEDFTLEKDTTGGVNNADIIFVLDVTGSMAEEIDGVKDNIIEFADSLSYRGINFRLGMVTFLDYIENVYDFTDNVQEFQYYVSQQYAHGGDDIPENSLDALSRATQFDFRENSNRIFIWITDADYHINDQYTQQTKESVINQLLAKGITVYCIGDPMYQTEYYDQIVISTGGKFFNINGNFRDILLEVSRLNQASNHLVTFSPIGDVKPDDIFKIEVHYAGLGGMDSISFGSYLKSTHGFNPTSVLVYPNPFRNNIHVRIIGSAVNSYKLEIYNVNGQLLDARIVNEHRTIIEKDLFDTLDPENIRPNQVFFLKTTTVSPTGDILYDETKKIRKF